MGLPYNYSSVLKNLTSNEYSKLLKVRNDNVRFEKNIVKKYENLEQQINSLVDIPNVDLDTIFKKQQEIRDSIDNMVKYNQVINDHIQITMDKLIEQKNSLKLSIEI